MLKRALPRSSPNLETRGADPESASGWSDPLSSTARSVANLRDRYVASRTLSKTFVRDNVQTL